MNKQSPTHPTKTVFELISARQTELGISDRDLCEALGFDRAIILTLIQSGNMRFPLNKVPELARALSLDAGTLLRQVMQETSPGLLGLIQGILNPLQLTESETNLIKHLRRLAGDTAVGPVIFEGRGVIALVAV